MVVCFWLLILLLVPCTMSAKEPPAKIIHCLHCHPVHYATRASCVECHKGVPDTRRLDIAHSNLIAARYSAFTLDGSAVVERGQQRLKDYACRRCHISDNKGNRLAANLDLAPRYSKPEELDEAIKTPVLFMPEFHFTEQHRTELINALLDGARRSKFPEGEVPGVIHFEGEGAPVERLFEKHCGGCHRVLTAQFGGLGSGLIGPNLSGLFTESYLANFSAEGLRWNRENLEKWLKNPRKFRPLSQMPPVSLKADELEKLVLELQTDEPVAKAPADKVP